MSVLPRIKPGQVITAEFLNQLATAIDRLNSTLGGDAAGRLDAMVATLAALSPEVLIWCRISGVYFRGDLLPIGAVTRASVGLPSEWTYGVVGIGRPGINEPRMAPVYGRPVVNDEALIHPALVDMICCMVRLPSGEGAAARVVGELMLLPGSEVPARRRCNTPSGGGNVVSAMEEQKKKLRLPPPDPRIRIGFDQIADESQISGPGKGGEGVQSGEGPGGIGTPGGEGGPGL